MARDFTLVCNACGSRFPSTEDGYRLTCCPDGLLVGDYPTQLNTDSDFTGLWRFHSWLPTQSVSGCTAGGATIPAPDLGKAIGSDNLWLSFNGFHPRIGADCPTASFKDLEAVPTLQRLSETRARGVVVATAGNTGRAFAHFGGQADFPTLIVIAESQCDRIWRPGTPQAHTTRILALQDATYGDAITCAATIAEDLNWQVEGGVRNIARRDGIGTLLLDAVEEMGCLPDHYVQAVGGGPGPIGVASAAQRLVDDGRWGPRLPRFHLMQNVEHQPVNNAWIAKRDHLDKTDFPVGDVNVYADVLVNQNPAYAVTGGLFDVLTKTGGFTYGVTRKNALAAHQLFEAAVGVQPMEPVAVALAGLHSALDSGTIDSADSVLLAVTGGGIDLIRAELGIHPPDRITHCSISSARQAAVELMKDLA